MFPPKKIFFYRIEAWQNYSPSRPKLVYAKAQAHLSTGFQYTGT